VANENVTRVTADASGYTAELSKAARSAQAFAESNEAASRRIAAAQEAVAEATANGSNASVRSINSFMNSLTRQADTAGKTRTELLRMQAAQLGVSAAAEASIAKIEAAAAATSKASGATHEFSLDSASARRELVVLAHELSQGNIKNFAGSMLVLAERTDAMSLIFNKTALTAGAFVGILIGAVSTTVHAAEALAEYGETIEKISRSTGLSTDSIQSFGFAAGTVGVKTKDASDALASLGKAQNEALHGNNDAVAAFKSLGISLDTLKSASPDQVLSRVADAFAGAQDGASKAAVATELFGSAGADLIPLLDGGSQKLDALTKSAQDAGAVLGGDTIAQLSAFKEQLELSQQKMEAANLTAKTALIPTILNLTAAMGDNVALKPLLVDFYNGVGVIIKSAASAVATLVVGFEQTSEVVATLATVVGYGLTGQFKLAAASAQVGFDNLKKQGAGYADFMAKLWSNTAPVAAHAATPTGTISYAQGQNSPKKINEDALNAQMRDLKEQLDAREKLIGASVDHIKSLQQQGIIDAQTAIQQEHDARAAGYADELKIADQEIELAQHKKQAQALTEWQGKKKAIQALIAKNDQDTADATALLQAKESAATKAYTDALNTAFQTRADAIASQLQGKTLGATDADDLARASAAAKDYSEKYASLTKSLTENKISTTQYDDEITALQAYESRRLALESQATDQIKQLNADGFAGAEKAAADYAEEASNSFKQVGSTVSDLAKGMEDAFVTFVTTGKVSFSSLATSIIADIVRIQARAAIAQATSGATSWLSGLFSTAATSLAGGLGSSTSSSLAVSSGNYYTPSSPVLFKALGGAISGPGTGTSDSIHLMASNGEFIVNAQQTAKHRSLLEAINNGGRINGLAKFASGGYVGAASSVTSGGSGDVSIQVVNNGSSEVQKPQVSTDASGKKFIRLIIDQAKNEIAGDLGSGQGSASKALSQRFGLTPRFR
jgi:lambda family phage tail tape measure protein